MELCVAAGLLPLARIPLDVVIRRFAVVAPFLAAAAVVPFVSDGQPVDVGPFAISQEGLVAAWGMVAKASVGVITGTILTATTVTHDLLVALERLRTPRTVVSMVALLLRYADLFAERLRTARDAMRARGWDGRWIWQAAPAGAVLASTFLRSQEQAERVHRAMLARGFTGTFAIPDMRPEVSSLGAAQWWAAMWLPAVAAALAVVSLVL